MGLLGQVSRTSFETTQLSSETWKFTEKFVNLVGEWGRNLYHKLQSKTTYNFIFDISFLKFLIQALFHLVFFLSFLSAFSFLPIPLTDFPSNCSFHCTQLFFFFLFLYLNTDKTPTNTLDTWLMPATLSSWCWDRGRGAQTHVLHNLIVLHKYSIWSFKF